MFPGLDGLQLGMIFFTIFLGASILIMSLFISCTKHTDTDEREESASDDERKNEMNKKSELQKRNNN